MNEFEQKAFDLVNKFYFSLPNNGYMNSGILSCKNRMEEAKKCALICVEEIITEMSLYYDQYDCTDTLAKVEFWLSVKECIIKKINKNEE